MINEMILIFPFLDGGVPHANSSGVYISQLLVVRFARMCSNESDFNIRNKFLTAKLLKQGYRYHKGRRAELIVKYNVGFKSLLQQGILEPVFYGYSVYNFKRNVGKPSFHDQFKKTKDTI